LSAAAQLKINRQQAATKAILIDHHTPLNLATI